MKKIWNLKEEEEEEDVIWEQNTHKYIREGGGYIYT